MFSGIIEEIGQILEITRKDFDLDLLIKALTITPILKIGDSISVNGACLTVREINHDSFKISAANETLLLTNLGEMKIGSKVNLESSLTLNKAIGGHLVQGHITGKSFILETKNIGESTYIKFKKPDGTDKYIVKKGYIAIDGTSLTICEEQNDWFEVMIIPHTMNHTIAQNYQIGSMVNIEVDVIGRYLEKFYGAKND